MPQVHILRNETIAPNVYVLEFSRFCDFVPGQVISVQAGDIPARVYSIASGCNEPNLRLLYDVKQEGLLTPKLSLFEHGRSLTVSEPFGNFKASSESSFWIATGTGIAPFYSMFRSGLGKGNTLIHGARSMEHCYFQQEFLMFFQKNYYRCISEKYEENCYFGRLTSFLKAQKKLPKDQKYYLCGSSEMVVEVRDILISKGIPFNKILSEIYF